MTIEKLKRYRELKTELEDIRQNMPIAQDSVQGSQKEYPYILQNRRISGVTDENYSLLEQQSELKAEIDEIEKFMKSISDKQIKKIIELRYINGKRPMSWQAIAMKIGYCSEHTPKRILEKYFQNGGNGGF